jgi:hypothetical protein
MLDLTSTILEGADELDRRDAFDEADRRAYMNASEAMQCIRKQWYMKFTEVPEQDWGYARRGKVIEAWNVSCLLAAGVDLRLSGGGQETIYSDKHRISATPDGVIVTNEGIYGVEFKSIDPRTNRSNLPKKGQVEQLQIGMALVDMIKDELGLPDVAFLGGYLHYTDASNLNDQTQVFVRFDPGILDKVKPRADRLFAAKTADALAREGRLDGGHECRMCAFTGPCGVDGAKADTGSQRASGTRLSRAVTAYLDGQAMEASGREQKTAAADKIKAAMKNAGKTMDEVDGHIITYTKVAGRKTLDRKAVEAAGIDLTPFEKTGAPSERLVVK